MHISTVSKVERCAQGSNSVWRCLISRSPRRTTNSFWHARQYSSKEKRAYSTCPKRAHWSSSQQQAKN
eukprot:6203892-Pleurochrysis_carterae.AAC.3